MSAIRRNAVLLNLLVIAITIVFVATALIVGRAQAEEPMTLDVGDFAPETYIAPRFIQITDEAATEAARNRAELNTEPVYAVDRFVTQTVRVDVQRLFQAVRDAAFDESFVPPEGLPPDTPVEDDEAAATTTTLPPTTTTPPTTAADGTTTTTTTTTTTLPPTTTTTLPRVEIETQVAEVIATSGAFSSVVPLLVEIYNKELDNGATAESTPIFDRIEQLVLEDVDGVLADGIRTDELSGFVSQFRINPDPVFIPGVADLEVDNETVADTIGEIVAEALQANEFLDQQATDDAVQLARAAVETVTVEFVASQPIVELGRLIDAVQLDAITQLGLLEVEEGESRRAVAVLGAIAVLLTAFFLWRIAPSQWSQPKHFALLGVLLVLAAGTTRLPEIIAQENAALGYTLPAVMFGYLAAILYDPRTAVLMSVPMAIFTAISTSDPALTIFAGAATVAPVAFVSSVSSRRQLRVAVALSAAVLGPLAASIAWLFPGDTDTSVGYAALFAVLGGTIAGLVAQGLLSFLENAFRVTTTITLLDLTDRNHPALRLIEEQAPGTFNHSILVGTLAGKAARAIGADPLLAQAAAFYHDLGKTKQPQYYIENQFGVSNPHDELAPEDSAAIIGAHVVEGLRLARQYRLPAEIADGIRMHHGTGLMRYFYHKALEDDPGADPAVYRHTGEKPKRKEMAILMVSDACEGAARALAQQEDPTADSLRKLVDSVVGEKLEDGQLDESDLTFGDLTRVKLAIVEALIGYYHTRIPYPGFPGPRVESP